MDPLATIADFVPWLDSELAKLDGKPDRPIGGSGTVHLPVAKQSGTPGPAEAPIQLYQPSPLYVAREMTLDAMERILPAVVRDDLLRTHAEVNTLRQLRSLLRDCLNRLTPHRQPRNPLVVSTQGVDIPSLIARQATQRDMGWPPSGWETDRAPQDASLEASRQWIDEAIERVGILADHVRVGPDGIKHRGVLLTPEIEEQAARTIRDACRLADHLSRAGIPISVAPARDTFNPDQAVSELRRIRRALSELPQTRANPPAERPAESLDKVSFNARMIDTLQKNSDSRAWTVRQWGEHLGCSASTVAGQPAWKELMKARDAEAVARKMRDDDRANIDRRKLRKRPRPDK